MEDNPLPPGSRGPTSPTSSAQQALNTARWFEQLVSPVCAERGWRRWTQDRQIRDELGPNRAKFQRGISSGNPQHSAATQATGPIQSAGAAKPDAGAWLTAKPL